jgi:hypothetical protein
VIHRLADGGGSSRATKAIDPQRHVDVGRHEYHFASRPQTLRLASITRRRRSSTSGLTLRNPSVPGLADRARAGVPESRGPGTPPHGTRSQHVRELSPPRSSRAGELHIRTQHPSLQLHCQRQDLLDAARPYCCDHSSANLVALPRAASVPFTA